MHSTISILSLILICCSALAQTAGRASWKDIAVQSSSAVTGYIENQMLVVRRDKMLTTSDKGIVNLPNPKDYVVGNIIQLRLERIVKNDGLLKAGGVVEIFLPGEPSEGTPILMTKRKYLVLLAPLKSFSKENFKATIFNPKVSPEKEEVIKPATYYSIVNDSNGVQEITARNQKSIDAAIKEIEMTIQKPRK